MGPVNWKAAGRVAGKRELAAFMCGKRYRVGKYLDDYCAKHELNRDIVNPYFINGVYNIRKTYPYNLVLTGLRTEEEQS